MFLCVVSSSTATRIQLNFIQTYFALMHHQYRCTKWNIYWNGSNHQFINFVNTYEAGLNQAVHAKTTGLRVALRARNSGAESGKELFKGSKNVASLAWGLRIFCEWHHKWRILGHLGPLHLALGPNY